jgi:two-component system, OmpR family, sensor histidine kinase TctE
VTRDGAGNTRLQLPERLASAYAASSDDIFAVRDNIGRVLAASSPEFGERVAKWPLATSEPAYFHLTNLGPFDYYGLSVELDSAAGPVSVWVARAAGSGALVHSLLQEFIYDVAWVSPLFMAATLAIGFLAIRSGFKPVENISRMAAAIGPEAISVRLPADNLPTEVKPLVNAVNRALDRLERGFAVQRQFTANAAHELRTPLAIVTGALESMKGNGEAIADRCRAYEPPGGAASARGTPRRHSARVRASRLERGCKFGGRRDGAVGGGAGANSCFCRRGNAVTR